LERSGLRLAPRRRVYLIKVWDKSTNNRSLMCPILL
jgi:hypothetical protein